MRSFGSHSWRSLSANPVPTAAGRDSPLIQASSRTEAPFLWRFVTTGFSENGPAVLFVAIKGPEIPRKYAHFLLLLCRTLALARTLLRPVRTRVRRRKRPCCSGPPYFS